MSSEVSDSTDGVGVTTLRKALLRRTAVLATNIIAAYFGASASKNLLVPQSNEGREDLSSMGILERGISEWQEALSSMGIVERAITVMAALAALLASDFAFSVYFEMRQMLVEKAAPRAASLMSSLPRAVLAVVLSRLDYARRFIDIWRFDGRYKRRMAEEFRQLHRATGRLNATSGFELKEAYTELSVEPVDFGRAEGRLFSMGGSRRAVVYPYLRGHRPGTAIAILGRPGGGKSTLLRHLALLHATNGHRIHGLPSRVPIFIELRRVADLFTSVSDARWNPPSLASVIEHYWSLQPGLSEIAKERPPFWLAKRLSRGNALILIDGLDEVPHPIASSDSASESPRRRVSKWIQLQMQLEENRKCLFVITSRPSGYLEAPLDCGVACLQVQPLSNEQTKRFIAAFNLGRFKQDYPGESSASIKSRASRESQGLIRELEQREHIRKMQANPLLLHMICLSRRVSGRLPEDRSDLYQETCTILLDRSYRSPGIKQEVRPVDMQSGLEALADHFMRSASAEPRETKELVQVLDPVLATMTLPVGMKAGSFLRHLSEETGLIQEVERDRWEFAHRTFCEFLAAKHWGNHPPLQKELRVWVSIEAFRLSLVFYSQTSEDSPVVPVALSAMGPLPFSLVIECVKAKHRMNPKVREQAEQSVITALTRPQGENFLVAAQALFEKSMIDVQRSNDGAWQLRGLIANAEYMLFVDSMKPSERGALRPLHWNDDYTADDPKSPVVGISFWQAGKFAAWVADMGYEGWSLPGREVSSVPEESWVRDSTPVPPPGVFSAAHETGFGRRDASRASDLGSVVRGGGSIGSGLFARLLVAASSLSSRLWGARYYVIGASALDEIRSILMHVNMPIGSLDLLGAYHELWRSMGGIPKAIGVKIVAETGLDKQEIRSLATACLNNASAKASPFLEWWADRHQKSGAARWRDGVASFAFEVMKESWGGPAARRALVRYANDIVKSGIKEAGSASTDLLAMRIEALAVRVAGGVSAWETLCIARRVQEGEFC